MLLLQDTASPWQSNRLTILGDSSTFANEAYQLRQWSARPGFWEQNDPGDPLIINAAGQSIDADLHFEYDLNAYDRVYADLHFEYTLGAIVEIAASSTFSAVSGSVVNMTYNSITAGSTADFSSTIFTVEHEVDVIASSSLSAVDSWLTNMTYDMDISSVVESTSKFVLDGAVFDVWVFNRETFAPSQYDNFNFVSMSAHQGFYYGANDTGIFELTGATDAGTAIDALAMFGRDNFDVDHEKRVLRGYIYGTGDGYAKLKVIDDKKRVLTYRSRAPLADVISGVRVKMAQGARSVYWQMGVQNEAGGDMLVNHVSFYPVILNRRYKS